MVYKGEDGRQPAVGSRQSVVGGQRLAVGIVVLLIGFSLPSFSQSALSLDSCKKITLENNIQIKNRHIEIEASKRVEQAAFTKYFPNISAIGLGVQFSDPLLKIDMPGGNLPVYNGDPATLPYATEFAYFPGVSIGMMEHLYTGAITATQPLFTGGRIINGNHLARLGSDVSEKKLTLSVSDALFKTEEQYWQIISLIEKMKTINAYSRLLDTLYKDADNACRAGLVSYNEVLKVSLKQSEIEMNRLKLENGIKLSEMSFCQHLGIPYDSLLTLSDSVVVISEPGSLYVDPRAALAGRVEYSLVQKSVEAQKLQSLMKRGEYLPQVGIGVGAFTYDMNDDWNNNLMAFGTVTIPITDWWGGSYTIQEHRLKEEIAQNNADFTAEMLRLQIEKAWTDLQETYQRIKIAEKALRQAQENLRITTDHYRAGTIGIPDLLEAQALQQDAGDRVTEARCAYRIKIAEYNKVTGG
ncbi:MAG: TolC family protein [Bacteroidales bacterium]|nr:TolC family protein [Bacteroidales bacterium]